MSSSLHPVRGIQCQVDAVVGDVISDYLARAGVSGFSTVRLLFSPL